MDRVTRRAFLRAGAGAGVVASAGCLGASAPGTREGWRATRLVDVVSGEPFSIGDFSRPVLIDFFAVWCAACSFQQREIGALRERTDAVVPVSLNVDPNEDADVLRGHLDYYGFDWRFAVTPPEMTRALIDAFGEWVLNVPKTPVLLVCADGGTRRLRVDLDESLRDEKFGWVKSADRLERQIAAGCE